MVKATLTSDLVCLIHAFISKLSSNKVVDVAYWMSSDGLFPIMACISAETCFFLLIVIHVTLTDMIQCAFTVSLPWQPPYGNLYPLKLHGAIALMHLNDS